jgi:hypothetical protein
MLSSSISASSLPAINPSLLDVPGVAARLDSNGSEANV